MSASFESIIDISLEISPAMVRWPGHPPVVVERYRSLSRGDSSNSSQIGMSVHTGTHVDAPFHFSDGAKTIESIDLRKLIGPAYVMEVMECSQITKAILVNSVIPEGTSRILFKTRNSYALENNNSGFDPNYVSLDTEAAELLVSRGLQLVGIDSLSIQKFRDAASRTHHRLLENDVVILEGLDLRAVKPGHYELICLPLKIAGADGAPARAILVQK